MAYNYSPYQFQFPQYQQQQQIQNNGFVSVRSIEEAFNWPIAPGNSITFKDENAPFVYTKTKGFSPLEQPVFEKYRLVKVEEQPQTAPEAATGGFDAQGQIKLLWEEITALKSQIAAKKEEHHDKPTDAATVQAVHE